MPPTGSQVILLSCRLLLFTNRTDLHWVLLYTAGGDYVKFGFTMASATTMLAWGCLSYKDAYLDAGRLCFYSEVTFKNSMFVSILSINRTLMTKRYTFAGPGWVVRVTDWTTVLIKPYTTF